MSRLPRYVYVGTYEPRTKSIVKKSTTGSLPPAMPLAITTTFSPWTHTSDDSYMYQLSLVLATATVSFMSPSFVSLCQRSIWISSICMSYLSYPVRWQVIALSTLLTVVSLSLGRRLDNLLPAAQRTNALTNGVVRTRTCA